MSKYAIIVVFSGSWSPGFLFRCGGKGFCLEYDHSGLAKVVLGVLLTCKLITAICFGLSWLFCRRLEERNKKTSEKIDFTGINDKYSLVVCHETAI